MDKAGNSVNIVILDACRNNPFADQAEERTRSLHISAPLDNNQKSTTISRGIVRTSSVSSGLSRIDGPSGSFIAYATAPGNVAADGSGKNGLYTENLLQYIDQPGLSIEQVFKKVRIGVMKATQGRQVPWENSSLLGDFYFVADNQAVAKSLSVDFLLPENKLDARVRAQKLAYEKELRFWNSVEKADKLPLYQAYLRKYPQGSFVEIATIKLELLQTTTQKAGISHQLNPNNSGQSVVQPVTDSKNAKLLHTTKAATQISKQPIPPAKLPAKPSRPLSPTIKKALQEALQNAQHKQLQQQEQQQRLLKNGLPLRNSDFVTIKAGCFTMGSPFGEEGRQNDELDHKVCLRHNFMMSKYEVTQALWQAVMGKNPAYFKGCGKNCPIENVSWNDVQTFLFRLNLLTDGGYRLPTEAEWEYAARAGTNSATYAGDPVWEGANNAPGLDPIAWYSGNSQVTYKGGKYCEDWEEMQHPARRCGTHPVGKKHPNHWGLYDMLGNVWEWTQDWYGFYSSSRSDGRAPTRGNMKVARGGSWSGSLDRNRAAARYAFGPREKVNNLGFRLIKQK